MKQFRAFGFFIAVTVLLTNAGCGLDNSKPSLNALAPTIDSTVYNYLTAINKFESEKKDMKFERKYLGNRFYSDSSECWITRQEKIGGKDSSITFKAEKIVSLFSLDCDEWWNNPNYKVSNYAIWFDLSCKKVLELEEDKIIHSSLQKNGYLHAISTISLEQCNTFFLAKCYKHDTATYGWHLNEYKYENFIVDMWMIEKATNTVQGFTRFEPMPLPSKFRNSNPPDISTIEKVKSWADYLIIK